MATIKQQSKLIIEHPFFKKCLEGATNGDFADFERLFIEIQAHLWEKVALDASRVYGQYRRANSCDIKKEIRDMPPPVTLDLRLPFVRTETVIVVKKQKEQIQVINNQLVIF